LSKEKFVRDKPHVNIGLIVGSFIVGFALGAGLTYLYPDLILPATQLLFTGTSSLRDPAVHITRIFLNGAVYGAFTGLAAAIVMKGRKILQN
jgi:hypothetical protein